MGRRLETWEINHRKRPRAPWSPSEFVSPFSFLFNSCVCVFIIFHYYYFSKFYLIFSFLAFVG